MPITIGTVSSHITKEYFNVNYPLVRTSIYGLSADITALKTAYSLTDPARLTFRWELSSASTPFWFSVPGNTETIYLSSFASVEPINVRSVVLYNLREYTSTNTVHLKPYSSPADIPSLQLWLDANDPNTSPSDSIYSATTPAWQFTGSSNSGIQLAHHSSFEMTSNVDFTAEAWVYPTGNLAGENPIISKGHKDRSTFAQYSIFIYDSKFGGTVGGGIAYNQLITGTSTVVPNTWYHVALMRKSGVLYLFVNGLVEASATQTNYVANNNPLNIGWRPSPTYGTKYFKGNIAGVRIIKGSAIFPTTGISNLALQLPPLASTGSQTSLLALQTNTTLQDYSTYNHTINSTNVTSLPSETVSVVSSTPWLDKSPNALSAAQPNSAARPVIQSSAINGLSAVVFDWQKGQRLVLSDTVPLPTTGNWTHFFVYKRETVGHSISLGNLTTGKADTPFFQEANQYWDGSSASDRNFIKSSARNKKTSNAVTLTGPLLGSVVNGASNSSNSLMFVNNAQIPYGTVNWGFTMGGTVNGIGGYSGGGHNGAIGEIVHTSLTLPTEEVLLVGKQLKSKWGI